MAKYRIIKRTHPFQDYESPFCIQKRFLGFLWWHNPFVFSYGEFTTLEEAKHAIDLLSHKEKRTVIWEE